MGFNSGFKGLIPNSEEGIHQALHTRQGARHLYRSKAENILNNPKVTDNCSLSQVAS